MANLVDGIHEEIARCSELVEVYNSLGPVGIFGKTMIKQTIERAQRALSGDDPIETLAAYEALKGCE